MADITTKGVKFEGLDATFGGDGTFAGSIGLGGVSVHSGGALHIGGTNGIRLDDNTNINWSGPKIVGNNSSDFLKFSTDSTDNVLSLSGSNAIFAGDVTIVDNLKATGGNMKFHAGGTHVFNVDVNRNIYPQTHNSTDLGFSSTLAFRQLYLSGNITSSAGATFGGNVGIESSSVNFAALSLSSTGANVNFSFEVGDTDISGLHAKNLVIRGSSGASDIAFSPSTSYPGLLMLDGSSGNVGIGVTTPNAKLTVKGNAVIGSTSGRSDLGLSIKTNVDNSAASSPTDATRTLLIENSNTNISSFTSLSMRVDETGSGTWYDIMYKKIAASEGVAIHRVQNIDVMALTKAGNVGIGTTSPGVLLDVNAANGVQDNDWVASIRNQESTVGRNYGLRVRGGSSSADISLGVYDKDLNILFNVRGDGNVGIGTTSPTHLLDVRKNQTAYTYISADNEGTVASGTGSGFAISEGGSVAWYMRGERDGSGKFNIGNSANRLTIDSSGNVGIGTASPGDILHVSKAGAATRLRVGNNAAYDAYIYFNTSADWVIGTDISNSTAFTIGNHSSIGSNTKMVIETGGKVGIGTTIPNEKLHVDVGNLQIGGDANSGYETKYYRSGTQKGGIGSYGGTFTFYGGTAASTYQMTMSTSKTGFWDNKIVFKADGKVGIQALLYI